MIGRQEKLHRVGEQRHRAQPRPGRAGAGELEQQREIELAGPQAGCDLLRLALGQRHRDVGVGASKTRNGQRQQRRAARRERRDPQPPQPLAGHLCDRPLRRLDLGEDPLGVADERHARPRRGHAAVLTDEQLHPGLALQAGDRLRDRRLGVGERVGGRGERSVADDGAQDLEPAEIEH
jgi:hypothetical protein